MPLRCCRRFSARRSPVRSVRAAPVTVATTSPGVATAPSSASSRHSTGPSWENTPGAAGGRTPPAPAWRAAGRGRAPTPGRSPPRCDHRLRRPPPARARSAARRADARRPGPWLTLLRRHERDVGDLDHVVGEVGPRVERVARDARRGQDVAERGREACEGRGVGRQRHAGDAAPDRDAALGLRLVDAAHTRRRRRSTAGPPAARPPRGRPGRPRCTVDARLARLVRERPGPHLLGDVRQRRREEAQQHRQAEAQRRDRGSPPIAARRTLHQLEVRVGEVAPEERLGLRQRLRRTRTRRTPRSRGRPGARSRATKRTVELGRRSARVAAHAPARTCRR